MPSERTFHYLSGLPRTGSTLLSAILSQNANIHAEGNSALCQLMWDTYISCQEPSREQLLATGRSETERDLIQSIPSIYYKDVKTQYIFDKCRSWTLPGNLFLIKNFLSETPKIVVLMRPIQEILKSFLYLYKENNISIKGLEKTFLAPSSEPIMRSLDGVKYAMDNNNGEFLFVNYSDIVSKPKETIDNIYSFCKIEAYEHDLQNICVKFPEDDRVYGLIGQHDVRATIGIEEKEKEILISDETLKVCEQLNTSIGIKGE
jgi:sulfotransferase